MNVAKVLGIGAAMAVGTVMAVQADNDDKFFNRQNPESKFLVIGGGAALLVGGGLIGKAMYNPCQTSSAARAVQGLVTSVAMGGGASAAVAGALTINEILNKE